MRKKWIVTLVVALAVAAGFGIWQREALALQYHHGLLKVANLIAADLTVNDDLVVGDTATITGDFTASSGVIFENDETLTNATDKIVTLTFDDNPADTSEISSLRIVTSNEAGADEDYHTLGWYFEDDGSVQTRVAFMDAIMDDETSNTVDGSLRWGVMNADSISSELLLNATSLNPYANAGLDLGTDALEFGDLWIEGTAYLDSATITAGTVTTLNGHDEARVMSFTFFDVDCAASQSAAAWGMDASADVGGANFKGVTMPVAGSVIGISIFSNDACTSGTATADATINGTATGLQAALDSVSNTTSNQTMQANDTDTIAAGAEIGVKVTTTSTYTPTTADVCVTVFVEY